MTKTKFTPGPWIVAEDGLTILTEEEFTITDENRISSSLLTIANIESATRKRYYPTRWEAIANARLIAAAPMMFAALQNLENDDGSRMPPSAWKLVQDAIAKVVGNPKPDLTPMWEALATCQSIADKYGYGKEWAVMCAEKTHKASQAARDVAKVFFLNSHRHTVLTDADRRAASYLFSATSYARWATFYVTTEIDETTGYEAKESMQAVIMYVERANKEMSK